MTGLRLFGFAMSLFYFCTMVILCLFLQYGDIHTSFAACSLILTGDEKVVHIDAKCILSLWTNLAWHRFQNFATLLKYILEKECSQHGGRTIRFELVWCDLLCGQAPTNWFEHEFEIQDNFLTWLNCWKLAF